MVKSCVQIDTLILGAGAAGLMCAAHAGGRCIVVDHARAAGEKIRISGGGRCNFTNLNCGPDNFISENMHFSKSALGRYTPADFLALVRQHGIAWHEKAPGQLFCDGSARQIVAMLLAEMAEAGADLWLETEVGAVARGPQGFDVALRRGGRAVTVSARHLVVATGGKSVPKMGASGLAYDIARQFGLRVTETRPALVPLTFSEGRFAPLAGVALPARVTTACGQRFDEAMLFTHRGLSGPAILQASSYWREGEAIAVDLAPGGSLVERLRGLRGTAGRRELTTALAELLPTRLVANLASQLDLTGRLADAPDTRLARLADSLHAWSLTPSGSEGYRTAEATAGGVATEVLSARSLEARAVAGLHFIGECVDVTGWLGGYNFQWAWASGHAAGTAIAARST